MICTGDISTERIRRGKREWKLCCLCSGLFSANSVRWIEGNKGTASRHQETKTAQSNNFSSGFVLHVYLRAQQCSSFRNWVHMQQSKTRQTPQQPSLYSSSSLANQTSFCWPPLCSVQMVQYQLPMGFGDASHTRGGGGVNKKISWGCWIPLAGIWRKTFTKIEAHAGMAERLVRYLAIDEALQTEIKETLEHNNQSYVDLWALSDKGGN